MLRTTNPIYKVVLILLIISTSLTGYGQAPSKWNSCDIYTGIEKLNFLGSVLYMAAHPDDENTRLIAHLSNERKARTAYLSLTRGDGGQNLVGTELQELLGVLRTQELLMARSIDGGEQFFTRATDFGYSKHPDETLRIWNKDKVLSDVVRTIRRFRPDVIVNRFDHDSAGRTHGHHTSSAMLSYEAFDLSGDKNVNPEQLGSLETWSPRRLYFNTSWWFYGSKEKFAKADKVGMLSVDVGTYYPCKGKSNTEIAAESRSMHKCQGFGSTGTRGSKQEFLKLLKGDMPTSTSDMFEGINTTWTRVGKGAAVGTKLEAILANYNFSNPGASIKDLMQLRTLIKKTEDATWKAVKLRDLDQIIQAAAGMYLEAKAGESTANPGDMVEIDIEYINRSDADITLNKVSILPNVLDTMMTSKMTPNEANLITKTIKIPEDTPYTSAYWLRKKGTLGMYQVDDTSVIGNPETKRALQVTFDMNIYGEMITITKDIIYKYNDPEKGEVYQPFEITPPVSVSVAKPVYLYTEVNTKAVKLTVLAHKENASGTLHLDLDNGWTADKTSIPFNIKQKGAFETFEFNITAPDEQSSVMIKPFLMLDGTKYQDELITVDYDHIPRQMVLMPSESKLVKIALTRSGQNIGYIMGAGDKIPEQLTEIGYTVEAISLDAFPDNLKKYDAIISGIRAYNTLDDIKFYQDKLMDYVKEGGTYISQYTTTRRKKVDEIGPYPISISRERVSDELAEVRILKSEHPIFNYPNKITVKDFDNWIQERGLYFANEWDPNYEALLSANDVDEPPRNGGLIVAKYGEGYHIHTGYSWFRQLPAGVPGAFRIFTNMVSLGQKDKKSWIKRP